MPFACSICEQESTRICAFCTKDACDNHICERCGCCSDCCQCEVPLDEPVHGHAEAPPEHHAEPVTSEAVTSEESPSSVEPQPVENAWPPAGAQSATPEESRTDPPETPEA